MKPRKPLKRSTAPLKRSAPPKRKARVKQRRATKRRSARVENPAYLASVRSLPCYVCSFSAPSEPDHMGPRPLGRKADDDTAVPMCGGLLGCHRRRTDGYLPGYIACRGVDYPDWARAGKERMRAWCDEAIAATRKTLGYGERVGGGNNIDMETL